MLPLSRVQSDYGTTSLKPFLSSHGKQPRPRWKRVLISLATGTILMILLAWFISSQIFDGFEVGSVDNVPTLVVGDRIVARSTKSPARGDLVVYIRTDDGRESMARVVAVQGDLVEAVRGWLIVNGERSEEPYLAIGTATVNLEATQVPAGNVFLLRDSRMDSTDSRVFGSVPVESVTHRVVAIWWPLDRAGRV